MDTLTATMALLAPFKDNPNTQSQDSQCPIPNATTNIHTDDPFAALQSFIDAGYCPTIAQALSDDVLASAYAESVCMKKKRVLFAGMMTQHLGVDTAQTVGAQAFMDDLLRASVAPGLKGVIRGNRFNRLVAEKVRECLGDAPHLTVTTEEKLPFLNEIPDWCVWDAHSGRRLVGYNQLDLWEGGQQTNRGSKYVVNDALHNQLPEQVSVLSVVAHHVRLQSTKNKVYTLFQKGVATQRIAYANHLPSMVRAYFHLPML